MAFHSTAIIGYARNAYCRIHNISITCYKFQSPTNHRKPSNRLSCLIRSPLKDSDLTP